MLESLLDRMDALKTKADSNRRDELLEKRREAFEKWSSESDNGPLTDPIWFGKEWYQNGEYQLYEIQSEWVVWNAALDSVEIELPDTCNCCYDAEDTLDAVRTYIESAGLKVKP